RHEDVPVPYTTLFRSFYTDRAKSQINPPIHVCPDLLFPEMSYCFVFIVFKYRKEKSAHCCSVNSTVVWIGRNGTTPRIATDKFPIEKSRQSSEGNSDNR